MYFNYLDLLIPGPTDLGYRGNITSAVLHGDGLRRNDGHKVPRTVSGTEQSFKTCWLMLFVAKIIFSKQNVKSK